MDPALQQEIDDDLDQDQEIEAIIRLRRKAQYPPGIRVISLFDEIVTCRLKRRNIQTVYDDEAVISFKAARILYHDNVAEQPEVIPSAETAEYRQAITASNLTGRGIVIGFIDWGADFAHADFINEDGSTRFLALWDQNKPPGDKSPQPFGYGALYNRNAINKALKTSTPYQVLGYHPGLGDPAGKGMHGTHVMGIAASNGRSGHTGIAPSADIIFVHLGRNETDGTFNLGDSCRLLEAIDFIKQTAGNRPLVINISAGKHGGPHDGRTLVEMGIDNFLSAHHNTAICQSTGNYFNSRTHCAGLIRPGDAASIGFVTGSTRVKENEVEIWYSGADEFIVILDHPGTGLSYSCGIESSMEIRFNGQSAGWMYHRKQDPNNGLNMIDIFLYPGAPTGRWNLKLDGKKITDGRFHAWIERADLGQSYFDAGSIVRTGTTNTICNSSNSIVAGAYDQRDKQYPVAPFSSSGPTLDGRIRPHLLAPGMSIRSSKSSAPSRVKGSDELVSMSGTSMAAPYITGTIALILEGISKEATIFDIRNILFKSCRTIQRINAEDLLRSGYGIIDPVKLKKNIDSFNNSPIANVQPLPAMENTEDGFDEAAESEESSGAYFDQNIYTSSFYGC